MLYYCRGVGVCVSLCVCGWVSVSLCLCVCVCVCVCGMDLSCGLWCVQPYKDQNELFYDQMLEARRSLGAATYIGVLRI